MRVHALRSLSHRRMFHPTVPKPQKGRRGRKLRVRECWGLYQLSLSKDENNGVGASRTWHRCVAATNPPPSFPPLALVVAASRRQMQWRDAWAGGRCRPGGRKRTQPLVGCRCRRDRNAAINILFNWTREAKTGLVPLPFRKSTPKGTDAEHPRALRYKYKVKPSTDPHPRRLQRTLAPLAQPFGALRAACRGLQAAAAVLLANLPMQPAAPAAVAAGGGVPAAAAA